MPRRWFDSHLDLAYMAASGRDMAKLPADAGGPDLPAAVTFPSLAHGRVSAALGTIFIEPSEPSLHSEARVTSTPHPNIAYEPGDSESARRAGLLQLDLYHAWQRQGHIDLGFSGTPSRAPLCLGILIEGADCIRTPEELPWWVERGVVAVGLTWARGSRFATGNSADPSNDPGLSDLGRSLVRAMDETRSGDRTIVHDASHLSDRSLHELFELTDEVVIASHSNCRAIVGRRPASVATPPSDPRDHPTALVLQRHLTDDSISEIARRGGVIGLNLFSPFIIPGGVRDRRATIAEWCDHADHIAQLLGHHRAVGLGSDMDGGFSAARLPAGLNQPSDLDLLADTLAARGWSEQALEALAWENWAKFWGVL